MDMIMDIRDRENLQTGPSTPGQDSGRPSEPGHPQRKHTPWAKEGTKAGEKDGAHKEEEEESRATILEPKEDGRKAKARGSKESVGTVVRRGIQRRIAVKEKGKEKETEEKEDGAQAKDNGIKEKEKDSKATATSVANGATQPRIVPKDKARGKEKDKERECTV